MAWAKVVLFALADFIRHPIRNVRGFRAAYRTGHDLAQQGYRPVVENGALTFQRPVGTFTRQPDGSWKMEPPH